MDKTLKSAIIIPVPEADLIVKKWREKYDRVALLGIPAHVTLLFPFKIPSEINNTVIDKLQLFFKTVNSFLFSLATIETFSNVIFLSPNPRNPFIEITKKLNLLFPKNPPYGGKFPEINPHLTIGQLNRKDNFNEILDNISKDINSKLPIESKAREVKLMVENLDQTWSELVKFPLR